MMNQNKQTTQAHTSTSNNQAGSYGLKPGAVVLITGASSGIGLALAHELIAHGCIVYGAARRFATEDNGQKDDAGMIRVQLDVNDEAACDRIVTSILEHERRLDAVIFSAGFGIAGSVEDTRLAEARAQLQTNVLGTATLLPSVIKQMRLQQGGLILFISSVAAALPIPFQAWYSASKAALEALGLALRDELKPWHIRCMVVSPGDTSTGFTGSRQCVSQADSAAYRARFRRSLSKMEADEQQGMAASRLARLIICQAIKKNPPPVYTPGLQYQLVLFLKRLLPMRLIRWLIGRLYGG